LSASLCLVSPARAEKWTVTQFGSTTPSRAGQNAPTLETLKERSAAKRWDKLKSSLNMSKWKATNHRGRGAASLGVPQEPVVREFDASSAAPSVPAEALPVDLLQVLPAQLNEADGTNTYGSSVDSESQYAEDPCRYLCPRPDGAPCDELPDGRAVPQCPEETRLSHAPYEPRNFGDSLYLWEASNLWHNPLYFEDAPLERYGHTYPHLIQPFASVGKFGLQLVHLPYQMAINPVWKRVYPLGWYRPGECAPKLHYQIPLNLDAAATEAGVMTGLFFLIP
jgi:hypothetical protein